MQRTIGGDRLGAGKKMKVELHGYERSTHDLSYIWRSTMAPGTLVPFINEIALPGDTFDIDLDALVNTHPTIGPLFGSYKLQLDVFYTPLRLYNSVTHNNKLGVGNVMNTVYFPKIELTPLELNTNSDIDNSQINPSCLLAYLGIRGIGNPSGSGSGHPRKFLAAQILNYWETYKNYYANKMETIGAVLHTPSEAIVTTVGSVKIFTAGTETTLPQTSGGTVPLLLGSVIRIYWDDTTDAQPLPEQIMITTNNNGVKSANELSVGVWNIANPGSAGAYLYSPYRQTMWGNDTAYHWDYKDDTSLNTGMPSVQTFNLDQIDMMREDILNTRYPTEFVINTSDLEPYKWLYEQPNGIPNALSSQEGLGLKTYQSDLLNNWITTETIDQIATATAISTMSGSFTLDQLLISRKVYDIMNRIAISGGSFYDWLDTVWGHEQYTKCESPMYMGGLIKEIVFQTVISNSTTEEQPLGTLAGRGTLADKHKGGKIVIKVDEPGLILGIVSITPRIDYSQGNKWHNNLNTWDDLHKPGMDEIGFQDSINEARAWWSTYWDGAKWLQTAAGKVPAWLNYQTNINQNYGNFAISTNEMFMTLNRRYEFNIGEIKDLTTYIDPSKFNYIFAETQLDAQNFWVQISVDMIVRRKMSAKLMPNL